MTDDLQIRLFNLRPAYSRTGNLKTLATFDLEIGEAIRLRRCRLAASPARFDLLMPERAENVTVIDGAVRSAVINAARRLYEEQRPGVLAA